MNALARIQELETALTPLGAEMVGALGVEAQVAFGELTLMTDRDSILEVLTALKDRFGSQIRTHYPQDIGTEVGIMEQERSEYVDEGITTTVPAYMKELLAEISHLARRSPEDQVTDRSADQVANVTSRGQLVRDSPGVRRRWEGE